MDVLQSVVEIGSPFLFEVPNPENVVGSTAPEADDGSAMKAHSLPGACSHTGVAGLPLVTLFPLASKRFAQSGPASVALPRRMRVTALPSAAPPCERANRE